MLNLSNKTKFVYDMILILDNKLYSRFIKSKYNKIISHHFDKKINLKF